MVASLVLYMCHAVCALTLLLVPLTVQRGRATPLAAADEEEAGARRDMLAEQTGRGATGPV